MPVRRRRQLGNGVQRRGVALLRAAGRLGLLGVLSGPARLVGLLGTIR